MTRKSNQELKELITKFFALDPTPEQIELFAVNDVLPHDKRSIVDIMTGHITNSYKPVCWACDIDMDAMVNTKIDTWPKCESIWNTYMTDKELPEGFQISTYHNDVCPSISDKSERIYVWFHDEHTWADRTSERPMFKYEVTAHHREGVYGEDWDDSVCTQTNSWDEVLQAINTWRERARKMVAFYGDDLLDSYLPDGNRPYVLELHEFKEWGAYQAIVKIDGRPVLYYAPIKKDGTPDMGQFGETQYFDDSTNSDHPFNFLDEINSYFGTEFKTSDFDLMGGTIE